MQGKTLSPMHVAVPPTGVRLPDNMQDDPVARQLLQEAHAQLYKWPATFAGYQAALTVQEEERLWQGEATVRPQQAVIVQVDGDDSLRAWVQESLTTQAMHFTDIGVAFAEPQVDLHKLLAHKNKVVGKLTGGLAAMAKMRKVTVVQGSGEFLDPHHMTAPDGTQRINTIERYEGASDGRLFATHYVVAHFPAHGANLVGLASYVNEFVEHEAALLLPSRRTIWHVEGGRTRARVIELSAHRVLG